MDKLRNAYIKDIRNWYHVLIALTIGYDISLLFFSNRKEFPISWEYWNNALYPFIGGVLLWGGSFLWEYKQDRIKANSSDMRDVWVSSASTVIGGYLTMVYANWYVAGIFTILSAILVITHYKK